MFLKTVTKIPLNEIWSNDGIIETKRKCYLTRNELTEMLKQYPVEFVIANIGDNLKWIPVSECFENWKSNIKANVAENLDSIELEKFPNEFVYIASEWKGKNQTPIVLLEKCH